MLEIVGFVLYLFGRLVLIVVQRRWHFSLVIFYSLHLHLLLVAFLLVTHCIFTRYSLRFYQLLVGFVLITCCVFTPYLLLSYLLSIAFLLVMNFLRNKV